jgi:hypothetical protein
MAGIMVSKDIVAFGLCLLVVMASLPAETDATTCNLYSLMPCLSAVEGARPPAPSASCCKVVKTVDKNCLCAQLKSGSYPKQMVENALLLPKKCGRTNLAGFRCGGKRRNNNSCSKHTMSTLFSIAIPDTYMDGPSSFLLDPTRVLYKQFLDIFSTFKCFMNTVSNIFLC